MALRVVGKGNVTRARRDHVLKAARAARHTEHECPATIMDSVDKVI